MARGLSSSPPSGTRILRDCTTSFVPTVGWLGAEGRDPGKAAAQRAEALLDVNRGILRSFGVSAHVTDRSGQPGIQFTASTSIGALPLLSPVTGRPDFGLVIEPRFAWKSAGEMLAGTGFRILPELLPIPSLPHSERRVPPWVLSSVVLARLQALVRSLHRRFTQVEEDAAAPRGRVRWSPYATQRIPTGRHLAVPCSYPDLVADQEVRAAIHWTVRQHRASLQSQLAAGLVVRQLLVLCDQLIHALSDVAPRLPRGGMHRLGHRPGLDSKLFRNGLEAIEWTFEERGLAGLSDLSGLAWRLEMETFFEAWVEAIAEAHAKRSGVEVTAGRLNQTRVPLDWQPAGTGSQRSLVPDVVVRGRDVVLVLDAKYKHHAEDIERYGWADAPEALREQHRADVLQALAYSTLFQAPRVVTCLVYPASQERWAHLSARDRVLSRARVRTGDRSVELALLAVPLSGDASGASVLMQRLLREAA